MRIRVSGIPDDLASDCAKIAVDSVVYMVKCVDENVTFGNKTARRIARAAAGPHGSNYYKRITSESHGLTGEYGPTGQVEGNAVGAGYRHGPGNHDLDKSLDLVKPKFGHDVAELPERWFWP